MTPIELYISQLNQTVSGDTSINAKAVKFAIADLEKDEIPEVILWLAVNDNEYFGYEVLSFKDGSVYGYTLWYRSFMDLKEDGTFSFSGGAADNGIGTIKFDETGYTINNITYCESVIDSDNNMSVSYFVNHESATEEEFLSAIEEQGQKADAVWYDFTDDNISDIVR